MTLQKIKYFTLYQMAQRRVLSCLIIVISMIKTSYAAEWDNAIGVGFNIGYVDNIGLAQTGDEENESVAQLTPFISLHGEGGRINFDLNYQLQAIKYFEGDTDNAIYHQLFTQLNAELINKLFYLDLSATNSQSAIIAATSIPQDNISITDNRTNVTTTTISPYISTRVLSKTNLLLRYTLNNTKYDDIGLIQPDSENQSFVAELSSIESPVDWRLGYTRNEFNTDLVDSNYYEEASFTLLYNINQQFVPFTTAGNETNRIQNSTFEEGGFFWNIGIIWRPTPRTTLSGSRGERFYGSTNEFLWTTRGKRTNINVSYTEEVTNAGEVFAGQPPPDQTPPGAEDEFIPISIRPFIRKRLESNINYNYSKTRLNWYVFGENRNFLTGPPGEDTSYGTTLSWVWALSERTSPTLTAGWQHIESDTPIITDNKLWNINLGVTHITSERITSSITYRYLKQDSNDQLNNYSQNSINAGITIVFDNN